MKQNGCNIEKIEVNLAQSDVDITLRDLSLGNPYVYSDVSVPVADIYKWIRENESN